MDKLNNKILLIDGHSIMNRAYFALPDLTNAKGIHTNAIYGFLTTMFKIIDEEKPAYLAVAFDVHAPTFRHEVYCDYKAGRKPMQEELKQQIPLIKDVLTAMQIPVLEKSGIEADDILGTLARRGEKEGIDVVILSGDRDLLQIASKKTKISVPKTIKGQTIIENYFEADVAEKYKVTPEQYIELKALKGDNSDHISGVPGVGEKTAEDLMVTYGSIENIYAHLDDIKKKSVRENLAANRELLDTCLFLVTIKTDCDIEFDFEKAVNTNESMFNQDAYNIFRELELKNFYNKFENANDEAAELIDKYTVIKNDKEIKSLLDKVKSDSFNEIAISLFAKESDDPFLESSGQMSLFDMSVANEKNASMAVSISLGKEDIYYLDTANISADSIKNIVKEIFNSKKTIYSFDVKKIYKYVDTEGLDANNVTENINDIMIAEYLLNPLKSEYDIADIVKDYLGILITTYKQLFDKLEFDEAIKKDKDKFIKYLSEFSFALLKLGPILLDKLNESNMFKLYKEVEMPLSYVLYAMEKEGILVEKQALKEYGDKLSVGIEILEKKIYEAAGKEFNINSPKQLATILFEEMELPGGKKTKTGYSTSAEVLEKLAEDYPFVKDILEYRTLTKLKSTYADGLANYIDYDGRIRTTFNQTITATGRISSTDPNLQNIPMRMELGRSIRKVFIPKSGYKFVDADYSQIELRILAALSKDKELIEAYKSGNDIHAITASKVFHIPLEEVTDLQRRNAKAVNFGIVYGISSFGLGQDLSISKAEAKQYIEDYFKSYTGIKDYLDNVKQFAKDNGYSETLYGRRRPIPELSSSNFMQRAFGERVAMNAPIQGTAADIMKIAMINVYNRLIREKLDSKLILQVHDELVVEAKDSELEKVTNLVIEEMANAASLAVKLEVSCNTGSDWYEAK